jgi:hypothetical protein
MRFSMSPLAAWRLRLIFFVKLVEQRYMATGYA